MTSPAVKKILDALRANHDEAARLRRELEKALCSETSTVNAGPRPSSFVPKKARAAMESPSALCGAFVWGSSAQGSEFWFAQYDAGALSPEGRAILEKWLAE